MYDLPRGVVQNLFPYIHVIARHRNQSPNEFIFSGDQRILFNYFELSLTRNHLSLFV